MRYDFHSRHPLPKPRDPKAAINFKDDDAVERTKVIRKKNRVVQQSHQSGKEKLNGVECVIDAVGCQACDDDEPSQENPALVLQNARKPVTPAGRIGACLLYLPGSPFRFALRESGRRSEGRSLSSTVPNSPMGEQRADSSVRK